MGFDKFKKPSITASDAHEIKDIGYKYTWIKADPTFDGLKQVLFEPKPNERISLNIGKPKGKPDYSVINSIVLDKESIWKQEIPLNDNLVTIIGGRSTGKSTLLSSIAKSINKDIEVEEHIVALTSSVTITWKDDGKNENREINRLDIEKIEFHKSVREGYLELLKRYPNRIKRIDASQPREVVAAECEKYILEVLKGE